MADEKEVTIKVTTETDTAELEELDSLIDEIQDKAEIEGTVEVDDTSVTDALDDTEQLNDGLSEIDGMTVSPDVDTSGLEALTAEADEAVSSLDSLGTAAAGVAATAGFDQMIETADRINTSWNQLELTFGSVSDAMKQDISEAAAATGRGGGEIRGYFNQMGIAGVTNTQLLEDSFEALSGKAYQTGNSIESMESKMQTMVLTGNASNRMLKTLGLSAEDLAAAMGVSADQVNEAFSNLTPEERLQAITKAMGDGAAANEMYKNSYAGLKAQADVAMAGLMGAVGQAILPVVVPALQAATTFIQLLTDGFKALPGPVQMVIGGIGGFAAIALTLVGILGTVGQVFKMVQGGLQALNLITKLSTVLTYAQTAAQWALNLAMDANPIMLVVIALIALAAALVWAYENVDWFREGVNELGATLQWVVDTVLNNLIISFNDFAAMLGLSTDSWIQSVMAFILFIPQLPMRIGLALADALARALGFKQGFVAAITGAASEAYNGFVSWIVSVYNKFKEEVDKILAEGDRLARELPPKMAKAGLGVVGNWVISTGESSPGYMYDAFHGEIEAMMNIATNMSKSLPSTIGSTGAGMVSEFGNNTLIPSGTSGGFSSGDTVINIYGDVDSDKRVQQIIDVIRNELEWNNTTAGRVV